MYRCIVGFRTMGPVDILSLSGGQPGTMRVLEHWPPGSLCGVGDSSALQASRGKVPGATPQAQPRRPSPLGCLGTRQPRTSLPMPEHTGSVRGALRRPESQVSVGCCPDAHGFRTGCSREKAGAELGALQVLKGRMWLAPSLLASPGPLAGAAAPSSPPIPQPPRAAHRPGFAAPPPSVLPCSAALPLPVPGPAAPGSSATLQHRAQLGARSGPHGVAVPVCPLWPGAPGRAGAAVTSMGLNISRARNGRALP